jgi:hypothetical protein
MDLKDDVFSREGEILRWLVSPGLVIGKLWTEYDPDLRVTVGICNI